MVTQAAGRAGEAIPRRLVVRDRDRLRFVAPATVQWLEGCGNYVRLAIDGRYLLLRSTLGVINDELDRTAFVRISRSVIVNLQYVRAARRCPNGQFEIRMASGTVLHSSRRYRRDVRAALMP
jgi:two-component system LytT family response regulator